MSEQAEPQPCRLFVLAGTQAQARAINGERCDQSRVETMIRIGRHANTVTGKPERRRLDRLAAATLTALSCAVVQLDRARAALTEYREAPHRWHPTRPDAT